MIADFSVATSFLDDDDADRIYSVHPELREGCPTCDRTGTYQYQGEDRPCDCFMQRQLAKHYYAAGIGSKYQELDWPDYHGPDELVEQVGEYLLNHKHYIRAGFGLLLWGKNGTGKSLLANLVLKELVKLGYKCFSATFSDTIELFTKTWGNPQEKEWFYRKFRFSDVLLLDDLGRELRGNNNLPVSTFDSILRGRVQDNRPTLLTTNMSFKELGHGYGASVLSLLTECSIVWEVTIPDYRPDAHDRGITGVKGKEVRPVV